MNIKIILFWIYIISNIILYGQPARKHGQGCQDDLFNVQDKQTKLWGYRNFEGEWIIPAAYIEAYQFASGKAKVKKGAKFGMIDCKGYLVINCEYDNFLEFTNDKVWAQKGAFWGLLSPKGEILVEPVMDEIKKIGFENDIVWARKGEKWGIFSEKTFKFIINPTFSDFTVASDQISIVKVKDSLGLIENYTGKFVIEPKISDMEKISAKCFAYKLNGKWGTVNEIGTKTLPADFDMIAKWQPGLILAKRQNKYKLFNEKGKPFSATLDYIGPCINDFARYQYQGKWGYLNKSGDQIILPKYDQCLNFAFKRAIVVLNGKHQIINDLMKPLDNIKYDSIQRDSMRQYFAGTLGGKKQLLDINGKVVLGNLDHINYHDASAAIRVKKSNKVSIFDIFTSKQLFDFEFDQIEPFVGTKFLVRKGNKKGVINKNGIKILDIEYDSINYFLVENKIKYLTILNNKQGLRDSNQIILPLDFELISPINAKTFIVKKNNEYDLINDKNESIAAHKYTYLSNGIEDTRVPLFPVMFKRGEKCGLLNLKGAELFSQEGSIKHLGENIYGFESNGRFLLLDQNGKNVGTESFDGFTFMSERMLGAKKENKWGYVSVGGKFLIKPEYDEVGMFKNKLAFVKKDDKWGIIDMFGREFIKIEYDKAIFTNDRRILIKNDQKYELNKYGNLKTVE